MLSRTEEANYHKARKYVDIHLMAITQASNANHPAARDRLLGKRRV